MYRFIESHKVLLLGLASGLLLSLSWPEAGIPFLSFIGLVPLFFIENHIFKNQGQYHKYSVLLSAWLAFIIFNLLTTWWIMYASLAGMIVAVLLNSLFMAVPWALMHLARKVLPGNSSPISLIIFWLAFEYLHSLWDLSWNWLDLGNVFASTPRWVQWYEYTGVAGGTLWILVINLLIFLLINQLLKPEPQFRRLFWYGVFLIAGISGPALTSFYIWSAYKEKLQPVEVLVIQPNEDPYQRADNSLEVRKRINHMINLARKDITPRTRFVVAPEGASPTGIWDTEAENHPMISGIRKFQNQFPQAAWIFGSSTYKMYDNWESAPANARPYQNSERYYEAFNTAVMVPEDAPVQFYHKSKLVPGIERMPFFSLIRPLGNLVEKLGGTAGSLGTQKQRTIFKPDGLPPVSPVICYESIYGDFMKESIQCGASLIFIITNDGWWRDTPGYRQHNQYARLRAIEFRRSIARAASTGISSFIDQKGNIIRSTTWGKADAITASLNINHEPTFFSVAGNYIGKLSVFISLLLLLYILSQSIIRKEKKKMYQ